MQWFQYKHSSVGMYSVYEYMWLHYICESLSSVYRYVCHTKSPVMEGWMDGFRFPDSVHVLFSNCLTPLLVVWFYSKELVKQCFLSFFIVDRLQAYWEDCQTKLSDRMKQLQNMLQDSTNWLDAKKGVDHVVKQANERLDSWQEITYTVDALKKQNAELKVGSAFWISLYLYRHIVCLQEPPINQIQPI